MSNGYRPKFEEPKGEEEVDKSDEDEYEEDHETSESEDTTGSGTGPEYEGEGVLFDLYAISNHSGTLHGGKRFSYYWAPPGEYRQGFSAVFFVFGAKFKLLIFQIQDGNLYQDMEGVVSTSNQDSSPLNPDLDQKCNR